MGSAALALAWIASLAPLLLERGGALVLGGDSTSAPRSALCGLIWIALAGMPRVHIGPADLRKWSTGVLGAAPVLALALGLDISAGASRPRAVVVAGQVLLFVALSALAADLGMRSLRSRRIHAAVWFVGALGLALLDLAMSWGPRTAVPSEQGWISGAAQFSPLHWALGAVDGSPAPFAAFAFLIALCALSWLTGKERVQ